MPSAFAAATHAFDDWISGPAALVGEWLHASNARERVSAVLAADGLSMLVTAPGGRKQATPENILLSNEANPGNLASLATLVKGRVVAVEIPSAWVIERRVDLPLEAASHLDGIVASRMSALSPVSPSDVWYGHRVLTADREARQLSVAVAIVQKPRVVRVLDILAAAEARQADILAPFGDSDHVSISTRRQQTIRAREGIKTALGVTLGACMLASVIALAARPFLADHYAGRRASLETRAEAARNAIAATAAPEQAATAPEQEALAIKDDSISAIGALDDLAAALPLHSYATEVSLADGRMRLSGRTQDVPEVLTALESSGRFADSKLVGPALRAEDGLTSDFELDTRPLIRTGGALK